MLKPTIFLEYDIRGVADSELLSPDVEQLGRGLGTYLRRRGGGSNINVGRDCRLSSQRLRDALVKGLLAAGCNVTDIGTVPTPVLYHSAQNLKAHGAIMITGSHNPSEYNGFKSVCGADTLHGEAIQEVRRMIESADFETGSGALATAGSGMLSTASSGTLSTADSGTLATAGSGTVATADGGTLATAGSGTVATAGSGMLSTVGSGMLSTADAVTPYVEEIASQFHLDRRIKVVADAGNGTAGPVIHRIFQKLNIDATELFFDMDGRFLNHHPDPTVPANLAHLIAKVRETGADLGIAFDGDSDRIGAVDEHGNVIYGDLLLLIYAREILQRKPGATFIGEVKCSQVMYDQIAKLGGNGIMYKTGHSLIKAKMKEEHAELAGEMSGHMFFGDRYRGYDDALYAACRLIEIVARSGQPLSAQLAGVPKMVSTPEIRVDCPDDLKFDLVARVAEHFKKTYKTIDIDGVRVIFPQGWGLLRASNTQPVLVMRFEAVNADLLKRYQSEVEQVLEAARTTGAHAL